MTISRKDLVQRLAEIMVASGKVDCAELADFADAIYETEFGTWQLVTASTEALFKFCKDKGIFSRCRLRHKHSEACQKPWTKIDNERCAKFGEMPTATPPIVAFLPNDDADEIIIVDGRHRLVACREPQIRVFVPGQHAKAFTKAFSGR